MSLSITVPVIGQPSSTEAPKVDNNFTNIAAWANGNVDDGDLKSPNNAVRRLLLQSQSNQVTNSSTAGDYVMGSGGASGLLATGSAPTVTPPLWIGDAGLSGQPKDFVVASKTAYMRIRAAVLVGGLGAPGITFTFGLYPIASLGSAGVWTIGSVASGSTIAIASPTLGAAAVAESAQFTMPTTGVYALGVNLSGTPSASSINYLTAQLYGYNA